MKCQYSDHKWLEYLFWSLGKHFIRLQHVKIFKMVQNEVVKSSEKKLQNKTINLPNYIFSAHTLIAQLFFQSFGDISPLV